MAAGRRDRRSRPDRVDASVWDGERLFQAARFGTEMQYQHLVFEEFARRIQPMVDPFVFNNSPEHRSVDRRRIRAHGVPLRPFDADRHGRSARQQPDHGRRRRRPEDAARGVPQSAGLRRQRRDLDEINANIIRGLSRDVGNAIDEFIVTDVRSNLLGLPLDLGALNIARGRDTGIPSLNETRAQLYDDTGLADLKPYDSWVDFAANIKNAASIINFIAAYGTHATITVGDDAGGQARRGRGDRVRRRTERRRRPARLRRMRPAPMPDGTAATTAAAGSNMVDLWIGGLAEASPEFGGMLGTTFNYVFEAQMENLQNGDRLYYLTRTQGMNFLNQLEPNTFADMVMRNTDLGDQYATHLNGAAVRRRPTMILELDRGIAQEDYNGSRPRQRSRLGRRRTAFAVSTPRSRATYTGRRRSTAATMSAARCASSAASMSCSAAPKAMTGIYGDRGIDTLWGDGGNDYLNGGTESDDVFGGDGDDIIEDPFGDDFLRGNDGNDVITSARGFDLLFGNEGQDSIFVGQDAGEVFAGEGDDFILGGAGDDFLLGNEGDDWIEGGDGFDTHRRRQ